MDRQIIWYLWVFGGAILMLLFMVYQRIQFGIQKAIAQKIDLIAEWQKINLELFGGLNNLRPNYNFTKSDHEKIAGMPARLSAICSNTLNRPSRVTITLYDNPAWDFMSRDFDGAPGWYVIFGWNDYGFPYPDHLPTMSILAGAKYYLVNDLANPVTDSRRWRSRKKNYAGKATVYGSLLCLPLHLAATQQEIIGFLHIYAAGLNAFDPLVDIKALQTLASEVSQTLGLISTNISETRRSADE
jgi:hypothetical protein